ncbi:MAG: tetratricopeptide repeat protein [Chitinophagales bacterium]
MKYIILFITFIIFCSLICKAQEDYDFYKGKGLDEYKNSNYKKAEIALSEALLLQPNDESLREKVRECRDILEALALDSLKKYNEARNIFLQYEAENKDGNFLLGFYYNWAKTTEGKDLRKALYHYKLAMDSGHFQAKDSIDLLINQYMDDAIAKFDAGRYQEAFQLFEAFREVDGKAQYYLGLSYEEGKGVDVDEILAYEYYIKADANGIPEAAVKVMKYDKEKWKNGDCALVEKYNLSGANVAYKYFMVPGLAQSKVRPNNGPYYAITIGAYGTLATGIALKVAGNKIYKNQYWDVSNTDYATAQTAYDKAKSMNHAGYILIGTGAVIWISDFIAALARGKKNERLMSDCEQKSSFEISPVIHQEDGSFNVGINLGF